MSWGKGFVAFFSVIGFGVALLKFTVPDEQTIYERLSEDQKKEVDKKRASTREDKAILLNFLKSNLESDRPAWDVRIPPNVQEAADRLGQRPSHASYPRPPPPSSVPKP